MLLKEISYTHKGFIYSMENTAKTVTLCNIITIQNICFLFLKY